MAGINRDATVTIANGASLSGAVFLGAGVPLAVQMPAAFTGTQLTFQTSHDGTTYQNMYDDSGNEVAVTVAASRNVALPASMMAAWRYLKLRSGTAASPTAEGGNRTIMLVNRLETLK
jgi:YD repeat-containing protein